MSRHARLKTLGTAVLVMCLGIVLFHASPVRKAAAQPARPTISPTITPRPTSKPAQGNATQATPTPGGRITGTVIDESTGAPAPNIRVEVGDTTVHSDASGNYDRQGLAAGRYRVALASGQGAGAQDPVEIDLTAGATVVQHLFFRSQPLAPPQNAVVQSQQLPAQMPQTGGAPDWSASLLIAAIGACLLGLWLLYAARRSARPCRRPSLR